MKIDKETLFEIIGYVLFMFLFFIVGVTGQQFEAFLAIGLLSLVYVGLVYVVKKILRG